MSQSVALAESALARTAAVTPAVSPFEADIARAVAALDFEAIAAEYRAQDEFVFIPALLPEPLVREMVADARKFTRKDIHRTYAMFFRKGGTVGHAGIRDKAPFLAALHRSPSMQAFATKLAGIHVEPKGGDDAHAAALYFYQKTGDHVAFHYDACGCEGLASYTATFGVVNETKSALQVQLHAKDPSKMKDFLVPMPPGSFVFFCGAKVHHRVTPLEKDAERITFSFAYVQPGKEAKGWSRFTENLKDALLYFGPKALLQKNYK